MKKKPSGSAVRRRWMPRLMTALLCLAASAADAQIVTNIAWAKRDLNNDFYPDDITTSYRVRGQIVSTNFSSTGTEIYIEDTNDHVGILVRYGPSSADPAVFSNGALVDALGTIAQDAGLRYVNLAIPNHLSVVTNVIPNPPLNPVHLPVSNLLANAEAYEGTYVVISNAVLTNAVSHWPEWGTDAPLGVTSRTGKVSMFIDKDTDIDGQLLPTGEFTLRGIFSQYDTRTNANAGYRIMPRSYADLVQTIGQQPPRLHIVNSNAILTAIADEAFTLDVIGQDLNVGDTLTLSAPVTPPEFFGFVDFTDSGDRHGLFTWYPDLVYKGTTTLVTFEVTDGIATAQASVRIYVLSDQLANMVINEIHYDPDASIAGDANGDGVYNATQDEFVEIYNANTNAITMSNWTLRFGSNTLYTFPATVLSGQCAVVVFGGGTPVGTFGGATVYAASPNWSGLINSPGDRALSLVTHEGIVVDTFNYSSFGSPNQSITRDPDGDWTALFDYHTDVNPNLLYSPGTFASGKACPGANFTNSPPQIAPIGDVLVQIGRTNIIQITATDPETNSITFSMTNAPAGATLTSTNNGHAIFTYTGVVADAGAQFLVTIRASDGSTNGARSFYLYVPKSGHSGLVINEFLTDPNVSGVDLDTNNDGISTAEDDEFIEIVNLSTNALDLSGFKLYSGETLRHTFGSLTLPRGAVMVVFGGDSILDFTNSPAQVASTGGLALPNSEGTIFLYSPALELVDRADYYYALSAISWTRYADGVGGFTNHVDAAGPPEYARCSPGRRTDGTAFSLSEPTISITNPVGTATTVLFAVSTYTVQGVANTNCVGWLTWTNSLTAAGGAVAVGSTWSIPGIALGVGANLITLRATNSTEWEVIRNVTITRSEFTIDPPAVLAATGVNTNRFDANWTAPDGAEGYVLDVATNDSFSGGGGGGATLIEEGFEGSSSFPIGWDNNSAYINTGEANTGSRKAGMNAANDWIQTPMVTNPGTLTFWMRTSSDPDNWVVRVQTSPDGSAWTDRSTVTENGVGGAITDVYSEQTAELNLVGTYFIRWFMVSRSLGSGYMDDVLLVSGAGGGPDVFVPGYNARNVGNVQTFTVTGLTDGVTYYYRVRAYGNSITSDYSGVTSVLAEASSTDSDGDGMPNDWETRYFTNATAGVAGADSDGDGFSNLQEYLADTVPNGPTGAMSFVVIEGITNSADRYIRFFGSTGRVYTIQITADLQNGSSWSNLQTDVPGTGGVMAVDDPANADRRDYRLRVRVP